MSETLTESFCERCGTRYSFTPASKPRRLGRIRTLSRGLKSYVLSDASTLGDAMTQAREDDDIRATNNQLDQFHDTFNFCLSCRQYTCASCWNGKTSRCLSCSPVEGTTLAPIAVERPWISSDPEGPTGADEAAGLEDTDAVLPDATVAAAEWATAAEWASSSKSVAASPHLEDFPSSFDAPPPLQETADEAVDLSTRLQFTDHVVGEIANRPGFEPRSAWARRLSGPPVPAPSDPDEFQRLLAQMEDELDEYEGVESDEPAETPLAPEAAAEVRHVSEAAVVTDVQGTPMLDALPIGASLDDAPGLATQVDASLVSDAMPIGAPTDEAAAAIDAFRPEGTDAAPRDAAPIASASDVRIGMDQAGSAPDSWARAVPASEPDARMGTDEAVGAPVARDGATPISEPDGRIGIADEASTPTADLARWAEPTIVAEPTPAEVAHAPADIEHLAAAASLSDESTPTPTQNDAPGSTPEAQPVWWIVAPNDADRGRERASADRAVQRVWPAADARPSTPAPLPTVATVRLPGDQTPRRVPPPSRSSVVWPMVPTNAAPSAHAHSGGPRAGASDALWAASNREVASKAGTSVQACRQCGLSLSAAARFCRRCGSPQT